MSFALSSKLLEPSFHFSKWISGQAVDPKARMRLHFPGGWDNKNSEVFGWYNAQPHKFFQQIKYYKENQGVKHEFIVLPLQDAGGAPMDWFCRLERTADQAQQLAAIGVGGTEAYDYIQSFDSDPDELLQGCGLVAEITLPRDFDLHDVLAVCSAIFDHPQAHRYRLQQYNCYFFCWAIILMLGRRSASWENLTFQHMSDIRACIIDSAAAPVPAESAKLAHILSSAHDSDREYTEASLCAVLAAELSNPAFTHSAHLALSSMLWVHRGHAYLKAALKSLSTELAKQTLGLLIGGLDVQPNLRLEDSLKEAIDLGVEYDGTREALEGAILFNKIGGNLVRLYFEEERRALENRYEKNLNRQNVKQSYGSWVTSQDCLVAVPKLALHVVHCGISEAVCSARLYKRLMKHQKRAWAVRMLMCASNLVQDVPRHLFVASKVVPAYTSIRLIQLKEGMNQDNDVFKRCASHALDKTVAKVLQSHLGENSKWIRSVAFQLIASISKKPWAFGEMSPVQAWDRLLWDFLGDIIAGAILEVVLAEQATSLKFDCLEPSKDKEPLTEEPGFQSASNSHLQQFIEKRLVRLSKHDIDQAPIIKHIPVPATASPANSQEQMKNALEEIWCIANEGKRFRE